MTGVWSLVPHRHMTNVGAMGRDDVFGGEVGMFRFAPFGSG
jgi:hypothetical protein